MATCETCKANKVCDHNKYGFENCNNYISADVVEVVRCKDCIYRFRKNGHDKDGCPLDRDGMMGDNDFCSCGKRKEET
jgi:hypothetical protein